MLQTKYPSFFYRILNLSKIPLLLLIILSIEAARYGEHCDSFDRCTDPVQICVTKVCICDAGYIHVLGGCVSTLFTYCGMIKVSDNSIVADGDYESAEKMILPECIPKCQRDSNCKAAYHVNGFCFIVYRDVPTILYQDPSPYFEKFCNFTFPSISVSLSAVSTNVTLGSNMSLIADITSKDAVEFISWEKVASNNRTVTLDLTMERFTQTGDVGKGSVTLTITNLTHDDNGTYLAYVKSSAARATNISNLVTVDVTEAPFEPGYVTAGDILSKTLTLFWNLPAPSTEDIMYTVYVYEAIDEKGENFILVNILEVIGFESKSILVTNLEEYWQYKFQVTASTGKGNLSSEFSSTYRTNQAPPGPVVSLTVYQKGDNYTSACVVWSLPALKDYNGVLHSYVFLINHTRISSSEEIPVSLSQQTMQRTFPVIPGDDYLVEVILTNNESMNSESARYQYRAPMLQEQQKSNPAGPIAGGVVSAVVITIVIVMGITFWKRKQRQEPTKQASAYVEHVSLESSKMSDNTYTSLDHRTKRVEKKPVPLGSFINHVVGLMSNEKHSLLEEYYALQQCIETATSDTATSKRNTPKNRDSRVPYDFNRVKLLTATKNDYINASLLLDESYIITQYPLSATTAQFWQMIWEQNVSHIMMLNAQSDEKESWYFPNTEGSLRTMKMIDLDLTAKIKVLSDITVRKIKMIKGKNWKIVSHFYVSDLNVDNLLEKLLAIMKIVKENEPSSSSFGPQVVHGGSSGDDYSGVYSIVDYLVRCIENSGKSIDVFGTTLALMKGRMSTIHSAEEYSAVYSGIQRYIQQSFPTTHDEAGTYEYLP